MFFGGDRKFDLLRLCLINYMYCCTKHKNKSALNLKSADIKNNKNLYYIFVTLFLYLCSHHYSQKVHNALNHTNVKNDNFRKESSPPSIILTKPYGIAS